MLAKNDIICYLSGTVKLPIIELVLMDALVLRKALEPVAGQAGPPTGSGNIDTAPCSLAVHQPGVGGAAAAVAWGELVQARVGFLAECHPVLLAAVLLYTAVSSTGGSVLLAGL